MKELAVAVAVLLGWGSVAQAYEPGVCPRFEGSTLEGTPLSLATKAEGQWTIVEFWATWCAPCRSAVSFAQQLASRYPNLRVMGVNSETEREPALAFARERGWTFQTLWDPKQVVLEQAAPRVLPMTVLLDESGCVIWQGYGTSDSVHAELEQVVRSRK